MTLKEKYIGDRSFYKMVLTIALPIMIQNAVTNFVSLLDNIMVGQLGTNQMSGVSIMNQLLNIFYICIFGAVSGAGIFSAQFYGKKDYDGIRHTMRFKIIICIVLALVWIGILCMFQDSLISLFLNDSDVTSVNETLAYGKQYLSVMIIGMIPYALSQCYASTLRETGETMVPMLASFVAVFVNMCFNFVLIFGLLGFPKLGIVGAAIATVIARFFEVGTVIIWTHKHHKRFPFVDGLYRSLRIPSGLILEITKKGFPLLLNETMWAAGMAMLTQCYSTRGLSVIAALNISATINNMFSVGLMAFGNSIGIIVGHQLGAGEVEKAVDTDRKLIFFSVVFCAGMGLVMMLFSGIFPDIYNTTDEVKNIASELIIIQSLLMPIHAFYNATYFTLRSGGKTIITFLFDSFCIWVVNLPIAYFLSRYTNLPIIPLYALVEGINIWKCILGTILVKKRVWVNNMVKEF